MSMLLTSCTGSTRYTQREDSDSGNESQRFGQTHSEDTKQFDKDVLETQTGVASFYGEEKNGQQTASGEIYNMNDLTAAHISYPFGTIVRVTNLKNNLSVEVKINDRMPNFKGRLIDLSVAAGKQIDMLNDGLAEVKIEVLKWGDK